jgi:hypothetical protein
MSEAYYEWRISAARGSDSVAADVARHLHARQHLGKAVIICEQPVIMLSAVRKQWLKLCRTIQKQRAATLNADKILKYTHTITRMQHMQFTAHLPLQQPEADMFFITADDIDTIPPRCMTIYVLPKVATEEAQHIIDKLAHEALIVDYGHAAAWQDFALRTKKYLEDEVVVQWQRVKDFLASYGITPQILIKDKAHNLETMDDALDTLLNVSTTFMEVANGFQHAMEIARPIRTSNETRLQYDAAALLAHRVQALSPGAFTQRFLEAYNEDDTFFLYDSLRAEFLGYNEPLSKIIENHQKAGRHALADALFHAAFTK